MPVLFILLALYCWVAQWVDRINFLRQLRPPPPTHGKSMLYVYLYVLPLAIFLHVGMSIKFFYDICWSPSEADLAAIASPSPPPTPSAEAVAGNATSPNTVGGDAPPSAQPPFLTDVAAAAAELRSGLSSDVQWCEAALGGTFGGVMGGAAAAGSAGTTPAASAAPLPVGNRHREGEQLGLSSGCFAARSSSGGAGFDAVAALAALNASGHLRSASLLAAASLSQPVTLHCLPVYNGNGTTAAACQLSNSSAAMAQPSLSSSALNARLQDSDFCGADTWSSAKSIVYSCAVVTTMVLIYYVYDTRERIRFAEERNRERFQEAGHGANPAAPAGRIGARVGTKFGGASGLAGLRRAPLQSVHHAATAATATARGLSRWTSGSARRLLDGVCCCGCCVCQYCCPGVTEHPALAALAAAVRGAQKVKLTGRALFSLIMQRHPREPLMSALPADAHIRPPGRRSQRCSSCSAPDAEGGSPSASSWRSGSERTESGRSSRSDPPVEQAQAQGQKPDQSPHQNPRAPSSAQRRSQLDEHAMMYIPPLITTLLNSFCKDVTDRHTSAWLKDNKTEKHALSGASGTPESMRSAPAPSEASGGASTAIATSQTPQGEESDVSHRRLPTVSPPTKAPLTRSSPPGPSRGDARSEACTLESEPGFMDDHSSVLQTPLPAVQEGEPTVPADDTPCGGNQLSAAQTSTQPVPQREPSPQLTPQPEPSPQLTPQLTSPQSSPPSPQLTPQPLQAPQPSPQPSPQLTPLSI